MPLCLWHKQRAGHTNRQDA